MEPKELRIGNYVNTLGRETEIVEVHKDFFVTIGNFSIDYEKGDGIPLTEEWLTRFGFKKCYGSLGYIFWKNNIELSQCAECGPDDLMFLSSNSPTTNIKFVHQLQNLYFALTGSELTITSVSTP